MPEYDDLVEQAARALFAESEPALYEQEDKGTRLWLTVMEQSRDTARAVLSAIGPALEARGAREVVEAVDLMAHVDSCIFPDNDCTCRVIAFRIAVRAALAAIEGGAES